MGTDLLKSLETKLESEPFPELFQVHSGILNISSPPHPVIFIDIGSNNKPKFCYSRWRFRDEATGLTGQTQIAFAQSKFLTW